MTGTLQLEFARDGRFEEFSFAVQEWEEYVSLRSIPQSPDQKSSPTLTKKGQKGQAQQQQRQNNIPASAVNEWGFPNELLELFEVRVSDSLFAMLY